MKIQLAYKFTGEDSKQVAEILKKIVKALQNSENKVYSLELDPNKPSNKKEIYLGTLKKIRETDALLAIITSENKSEGMLMEIGAAFVLNKRVIVAVNKNVKNTHLRELADEVIEFENVDELLNKLKTIK